MNNEEIVRNAYHLTEIKDVPGFAASFTEDGTFTDESIGVVYRGPKELGRPVEIYAKAFHHMAGAVILSQLGVLTNLQAVLTH